MVWIKAHLTVVVVGAISLVSVVMIALGVVLSDVSEELARDATVLRELGSLPSVNERVINEARRNEEIVSRRLEDVLRPYRQTGLREPLYADAFATDKQFVVHPGYEFQARYAQALEQLRTGVLQAGDAPSAAEVQAYAEAIKRRQEKQTRDMGIGLTDQPSQSTGAGLWPRRRPDRSASTADPRGTAQVDTDQTRLESSIIQARQIRCYAASDSLDVRPEITDTQQVPTVEDMWYAQVALWLQQDVIGALAAVNDEAARQLESANEQIWVANLPVKHLIRIQMGNYVPQGTGEAAASRDRSGSGSSPRDESKLLPGTANAVFTQTGSSGNVDVVHFYMVLVIEAARLPEVLDAISNAGAGFYTPLSVSYETEPADFALDRGYVYGTAPTIRVTLVCEACMLRSNYQQWMPKTVAQAIADGTAGGMSSGRGSTGTDTGFPVRPRQPYRPPSSPIPSFGGVGGS